MKILQKIWLCALVTLGLLTAPVVGNASPGGTDKYGCHTNSSTGVYHCHGGGSGSGGGSEGGELSNDEAAVLVISVVILTLGGIIYYSTRDPGGSTASITPDNADATSWYADVEVGDKSGVILGFTF